MEIAFRSVQLPQPTVFVLAIVFSHFARADSGGGGYPVSSSPKGGLRVPLGARSYVPTPRMTVEAAGAPLTMLSVIGADVVPGQVAPNV